MKECQRCKSKQLFTASARSKDMNHYKWVDEKGVEQTYDGYALGFFAEGGGGDSEGYVVCLACGQMQGEFPFNPNLVFEESE